jgi:hypothetical protein
MLAHKLQANIEHSKIEIWEHGTWAFRNFLVSGIWIPTATPFYVCCFPSTTSSKFPKLYSWNQPLVTLSGWTYHLSSCRINLLYSQYNVAIQDLLFKVCVQSQEDIYHFGNIWNSIGKVVGAVGIVPDRTNCLKSLVTI